MSSWLEPADSSELPPQCGRNDLDFLAETLGEERPQRPVGQAHGENAIVTGAAFAAREPTGDLADGIEPLFVVNRQGEKVDALARIGHRGRYEDDGIAEADGDGTIGLVGEDAVLDGEGLAPDFEFVLSWFFHALCFWLCFSDASQSSPGSCAERT